MRAYCLTCVLSPESSEIAQAQWYGIGMLGCEEETLGKNVRLKCYFPTSASLHTAEFHLMDLNPSQPLHISVVPDEDWNAKWKQSMKPVAVVPGVWVSPAWLKPPLAEGDNWIRIEPKMAFGTGHHETTRLACRALQKAAAADPVPPSVLDIGTGSGILCLAADCFGIESALGIDIDPVCAPNLRENLHKNRTKSPIRFAVGDVRCLNREARFDLIVMNMLSSEGKPALDAVRAMLKDGGRFVWSGLLLDERDNILAEAGSRGLALDEDFRENEWWCASFVTAAGSAAR
jgi:ribosomal protein L11 methyltransferase